MQGLRVDVDVEELVRWHEPVRVPITVGAEDRPPCLTVMYFYHTVDEQT